MKDQPDNELTRAMTNARLEGPSSRDSEPQRPSAAVSPPAAVIGSGGTQLPPSPPPISHEEALAFFNSWGTWPGGYVPPNTDPLPVQPVVTQEVPPMPIVQPGPGAVFDGFDSIDLTTGHVITSSGQRFPVPEESVKMLVGFCYSIVVKAMREALDIQPNMLDGLVALGVSPALAGVMITAAQQAIQEAEAMQEEAAPLEEVEDAKPAKKARSRKRR